MNTMETGIPEGCRPVPVGAMLPRGGGAFLIQWNGCMSWSPSDGSMGGKRYRKWMAEVFRAIAPIPPKKTRTTAPKVQDTSREALQSQKDKAPTDCGTILSQLKRKPMTCDELETLLNLSHQTASARVRDLSMRGDIKDSGKRRNTRTGRKAIVWEYRKMDEVAK